MQVLVTTGAIRRAKLQSDHHIDKQPVFLQAGCPSCRPTNSVRALKGESITFHGFPHPDLTWGSFILFSDHQRPLVTLRMGRKEGSGISGM